jgi:hypothetical protein
MPRQSDLRLELQDRDFAFLRGLFECRVMTIEHVASLYFQGRRESAKKRTHKLKACGLIAERPRRQFEPAVLFLTRAGLATLRDHGILDLYPTFSLPTLTRRASVSELTLRHELAVVGIKAAFHAAARFLENVRVLEFTTWPRLNQFEARGRIIKPDAFVRLREQTEDGTCRDQNFYIELDRSTEPLSTLCERARSYAMHYRSRFARAAESADDSRSFQKPPFRVLYILRSHERRDHVAEHLATEIPPVPSLVWLASFPDIKNEPFRQAWVRPIDYKKSENGSVTVRGCGSPFATRSPRRFSSAATGKKEE